MNVEYNALPIVNLSQVDIYIYFTVSILVMRMNSSKFQELCNKCLSNMLQPLGNVLQFSYQNGDKPTTIHYSLCHIISYFGT